MQAIILAGGLGTRLRSVVSDVPKPMAPIEGTPFLKLLMSYWRSQGVDRFILSVGHKWEVIQKFFGHEFEGAPVSYAIEDRPLGTGGAMLYAAEQLLPANHFLFLNGDTFFEVPLSDLIQFHCAKSADVSFSLFRVGENDRYSGVELDADERLLSFKAQGRTSHPLINGGVYLIRQSILMKAEVPAAGDEALSLESGLFEKWIDQGYRLFGTEIAGRFIDIGIPEDYARAKEILPKSLCQRGLNNELWKTT